jgi:hypothetical protein
VPRSHNIRRTGFKPFCGCRRDFSAGFFAGTFAGERPRDRVPGYSDGAIFPSEAAHDEHIRKTWKKARRQKRPAF